ncbi:MAG: PEP-CTERM sorting domain-containing protein [Gemmatimonadaceae bacterium]|nr:PEP-CTERM sorting domain-containing protein [Gemmatimonadaceae bacterium]
MCGLVHSGRAAAPVYSPGEHMRYVHALVLATGLSLAPGILSAQLPVSTGAQVTAGRDTRWQVASGLTGGSLGSFSDAFVITSPVWVIHPSATWVGAAASGSLPGGNGDGVRRFDYVLRTSFTLNAGDALTYRFQCTLDNFWLGLFVNGAAVGGATVCGSDNSSVMGAEFTVGPSSFAAGLNTIEFRWQGDGITDGIVIRSNSAILVPGDPSVVPEPSTYALMATGLVGLMGVVRRRRAAV